MSPSIVAGASAGAVALHFFIRVLKSGMVSNLLAQLGLKPIPDKALPWLSVGLGALAGLADALAQGMTFGPALESVFAGLFAGTGAIALHETVVQSLAKAPAEPPAAK